MLSRSYILGSIRDLQPILRSDFPVIMKHQPCNFSRTYDSNLISLHCCELLQYTKPVSATITSPFFGRVSIHFDFSGRAYMEQLRKNPFPDITKPWNFLCIPWSAHAPRDILLKKFL
jgi:hypothetical protein